MVGVRQDGALSEGALDNPHFGAGAVSDKVVLSNSIGRSIQPVTVIANHHTLRRTRQQRHRPTSVPWRGLIVHIGHVGHLCHHCPLQQQCGSLPRQWGCQPNANASIFGENLNLTKERIPHYCCQHRRCCKLTKIKSLDAYPSEAQNPLLILGCRVNNPPSQGWGGSGQCLRIVESVLVSISTMLPATWKTVDETMSPNPLHVHSQSPSKEKCMKNNKNNDINCKTSSSSGDPCPPSLATTSTSPMPMTTSPTTNPSETPALHPSSDCSNPKYPSLKMETSSLSPTR